MISVVSTSSASTTGTCIERRCQYGKFGTGDCQNVHHAQQVLQRLRHSGFAPSAGVSGLDRSDERQQLVLVSRDDDLDASCRQRRFIKP
jgi:hypothetical protein